MSSSRQNNIRRRKYCERVLASLAWNLENTAVHTAHWTRSIGIVPNQTHIYDIRYYYLLHIQNIFTGDWFGFYGLEMSCATRNPADRFLWTFSVRHSNWNLCNYESNYKVTKMSILLCLFVGTVGRHQCPTPNRIQIDKLRICATHLFLNAHKIN